MNNEELIIEISYSGLGDHLFHSHIPRIAKEFGGIEKVYISNQSKFGHPDYKKLIWELNPFVDGFVDEVGIKCDLSILVKKVNTHSKYNLLDEVMLFYGFNNGKTWNQPELYYQPKFREEYHHVIYDPNFVSWIGNIIDEDAEIFFKKKGIKFDYIMKLRGNKVMYVSNDLSKYIETPTLEDFCDLIFSAKKLYCLTSGTATLASSLGKGAIAFFGAEQEEGFRHYKNHEYVLIPRDFFNRVLRKLNLKKKK